MMEAFAIKGPDGTIHHVEVGESEDFTWHEFNCACMAHDPKSAEGWRKEGYRCVPVQVMEWLPIESAPKGQKLIVGYTNNNGKWRTVLAQYWLPDTLESDHTENGFADEGWHESTEAYEELAPIDYEPTHWMPLPPPPKEPK